MTATKLKVVLVLVGLFLLGAIVGVAATHAYLRREYTNFVEDDSPGHRDRFRLRALSRRLDLSEEQEQLVRDIVERHRSEREAHIDLVADVCREPLEQMRLRTENEIRQVLTQEQRERFDRIREKHGGWPPARHRRQ